MTIHIPHRVPPIAALRALEAAARHLNFTKAANELNVTQSAISHQIRTLEDLWGLKLFERKQRLALTRNGLALAELVRTFLKQLSDTLDVLCEATDKDPLRVDMLQSFAIKWLVPRLGDFHAQFPDIDVWISTHDSLADFTTHEVDLAIRLGHGQYPNLHSTLLMHEDVFPVCTPEFLALHGTPSSPRTMLDFPLMLRLGEPNHPNWEQWFKAAGVSGMVPQDGPRVPDSNMALQAAMEGQGIALARSAHVIDDLCEGRLIRLFAVNCPSPVDYYLVCPVGTESLPKIRAFRDWILKAAKRMEQQIFPPDNIATIG